MQPTNQFYDHLEDQARVVREHEVEQAFRARYGSEQRDRATVRRELERGVPDTEIEEHLALASDFVRLNPGRDVRGYVRGLIDEEKSSFHALSSAAPPCEDGLTGHGQPIERVLRDAPRPVASRSAEPRHEVEALQRVKQQPPVPRIGRGARRRRRLPSATT